MANEQINQSEKNDSISAEFLQQQTDETKTNQDPVVEELQGHAAAAQHWDVSGKTIKLWLKEGMPVTGPINKRTFRLSECEPWVEEYRRQQAEQDSKQSNESEQKPAQDVGETINGPHRGDPCPNKKCQGKLSCYSQSRNKNGKTYYLSCARCNSKPKYNKEVRKFG